MKILDPVRSVESTRQQAAVLVAVSVLILLLVSLHTARFVDHDYREDEINTIRAASVKDIPGVVQWLAYNGYHPPGWRIFAVTWIDVFGRHESITRFTSALLTVLTLALVFRLAADLFDRRTGLIAVAFLGLSPFFQYYSHELRPYAMLAMAAAGLQLVFLRWLRCPSSTLAFALVGLGVLALYTHYFALYLIATLVLTALLLVRWNTNFLLRTLRLFILMGLSFTPWLLPILHNIVVASPGGAFYTLTTDGEGVMEFLRAFQGMPVFALSGLAIPISLTFPVKRGRNWPFRFDAEWRRLYVILVPLFSLLLALVGNLALHNLTPRNMMIITPSLAVAAAYQIRVFKGAWRWLILLVVLLVGLLGFRKYNLTVPFRGIAAAMQPAYQPGDLIVTNVNHHEAGTSSLAYYLLDWLPGGLNKTDMLHILEPEMRGLFDVQVDPLPNVIQDAGPDTQARFESLIQNAERLWLIQYVGPPFPQGSGPLTPIYRGIIESAFAECRIRRLPMEVPPDAAYTVTEYHRAGTC